VIAWSAHLSTLFTELPPLERPAAAAAAGFSLVESWWPPAEDPAAWAQAVRGAGLRAAAVNADGGDLAAGERGYCNDPARRDEVVAAAVAAARVAVAAGGSAVNLLVGRVRPGEPWEDQLRAAVEAVRAAAEAVAPMGGRLVIEHLNAVDVDDPLLWTPADAARFVELVDHPAVTVLFDAYHAAMAGLDPVTELDAVAGRLGHVQFADCPGRGAPGTGRLDLARRDRVLGRRGAGVPARRSHRRRAAHAAAALTPACHAAPGLRAGDVRLRVGSPPMRRPRPLLVAALVMLAALPAAAAAALPAAPPGQMFSPGSFWNTPLKPGSGLHPRSDAIVAELIRQKDAYGGPWMNIERYSVPIYRVGPKVKRVRVHEPPGVSHRRGSSFRWSSPIPVPARVRPSAGLDQHVVIWQPTSDTMWEFWGFQRTGGRLTAKAGARILGVSRSPGIIEAPYGATASGLPAAAGVVTERDIRRGRIDHAIAIAIPEPLRERLTLPATRTDGWSENPDAPMEGQRFRLDPSLDIASLDLHPLVRMVAVAAQRYGIVVRDKSGAVVFYGEDPRGIGRNPFTRILAGADRKAIFEAFPWNRLQALPSTPFCCWQNWNWKAPTVTAR